VFALQGRAREARGLSAGVHYGGIWGAAGIAAWINLSHGARMWGSGFAIVAACGSLAAPIVWHMYLLSQKNTPTTDPQQVRRARSRRRHHRKVARLAARMATALPQDLDPDEAWTLAWRAVHGAEPGITAALLADHHKAAAKVAAAMKATTPTPLDPALKVLAHPLTPGSDARVVIEQAFAAARPVSELLGVYTPDSTPRTPLSPLTGHGARTGAYNQLNGRTDTRTSTLHAPRTPPVRAAESEAAMEAKRQQARAAIRRTLALNGTPSPTEIGRAHGLSAEWGAKQIRAVRNEQSATPHPVPASVH
jgi:hypothetical protein